MKDWILSVFATSLIAAIAAILTPSGSVKRVVSFIGGILVILATVSPIMEISFSSLASYISEYEMKADEARTNVEIENTRIVSLIIQEKVQAYILDKAEKLGLTIEVEVETLLGDNGYPYPWRVKITGVPEGNEELAEYIESEIAVPRERQEWS